MSQHQHGPNCRHGPPQHPQGQQAQHGQQMPHGLAFSNQLQEMSPEQYFNSLKTKFGSNRLFFWHEVLLGITLDKFYQKMGAQFMRSLNCNMGMMIIASLEMAINFSWIPKAIKHITSGLFFALLFLLMFNYNVVVGVGNHNDSLRYSLITTMVVYLIVGLRGSGQLLSQATKKKSTEIYTLRPYTENPAMNCHACKVIRFYRAAHCPACNSCVSKHTRHSIVFGICIGASNQLFVILFFLCLWVAQIQILYVFYSNGAYGLITQIMFYLLNVVICWMSFTQFSTLSILNVYYGITEQELKTWMMQQYLLKIPSREFENNVDQGPLFNFLSILYSAFGLNGYENEDHALPSPLAFPQTNPDDKYIINWARARYYLIPQLPMHKNRGQIIQMMRKEEPKMIEMFLLQKQFREEVIKEDGNEHLNEFQLQQKVGMKMQAYMMKNMPQMMQQPSPDQQRSIQLQMLTHMKKEFANEVDLAAKIQQLHHDLSQSKITPIQANMRMRQLQQQLMQRKMKEMMKQNKVQSKKEQEQQVPMVGVADEDL